MQLPLVHVDLNLEKQLAAVARCVLVELSHQYLARRDGGRIDVRNDSEGRPQFVEVNPLAGLNPEHSDLCFLAGFKGLSYQDLIGLIMESFLKRHPELASRRQAA